MLANLLQNANVRLQKLVCVSALHGCRQGRSLISRSNPAAKWIPVFGCKWGSCCDRFAGYIPASARDLFKEELTLEQAKAGAIRLRCMADRLLEACAKVDACVGFTFEAG